jgi:hypothetical protein
MKDKLYHSKRHLPELIELEQLIASAKDHIRPAIIGQIEHKSIKLPFYRLELGSTQPVTPTLVLVGGIHGIERIGSQVILAFLRTLIKRLAWDPWIHEQLQQVRLVIYPIVNPVGMWDNQRCNGNGIDLMRNAPIDADQSPAFLVGGHRISRHLPWYRGKKNSPMEMEAQLLVNDIAQTLKGQQHCISLDCHSGFGSRDRIWFPYARSKLPWPNIANALAITKLFESTYNHHEFYLFEPQANSYTTHGDLWDYMYDEFSQYNPNGQYLPLTLEMGSWLWVKKNPRHLFNYSSLFNPILPHRHARIMRRHLTLFEFLLSAVRSMPNWQCSDGSFNPLYHAALDRWYQNNG